MTIEDQRARERFDHNVTLHPPQSPHAVRRMASLRLAAKDFGHEIIAMCPPCDERDRALTKIEDGLQLAVAAIARNQQEEPDAAST